MANTFYVRTADKNHYIEAKFLTDVNGNPVVSRNPVQKSFNLFDANKNSIGTNIDGYVIVPARFDIKTASDFGRTVSQMIDSAAGDPDASAGYLAAAMGRFANAFRGDGVLNIQTHYNGVVGQDVPAFRDGASYVFGVAGKAANISLNDLKLGGGAYNLFQRMQRHVQNISGEVFNSPENVRSMTDGYQAQQNRIFGLNPISRLNDAFAYDSNIPSDDVNSPAEKSAATQSGFPSLSSHVVKFGSNNGPVYHIQRGEDVSDPINQVRLSTYLSHDIEPDTFSVHPQVVSGVRPRTAFDGHGSSWNSLSENATPSNANLSAPPPQPGQPLGIGSGEPMPQWVEPPPIFGFTDDARTSGKGPLNRSQPDASMFDTRTPQVPFVAPNGFPSVSRRAPLGNGSTNVVLAPKGNAADAAFSAMPSMSSSQVSASPVLQYLANLRQRNGNNPQNPVTGDPMPQWVVPPPIVDSPDDARAQGKSYRSRSRPGTSMFDSGTPPVPFVSPGAFRSVSRRAMLDNGPANGSSAPNDDSSDTTSLASVSPVLQYLQDLRQQRGNSPQQFLASPGVSPAPLVPAASSGPPIGGLLARLMAVAGIDPDDPSQAAPPPFATKQFW